jgi:hypothetical protein
MHCHSVDGAGLAAAHLETTFRDHALDKHTVCLDGERLQKVHSAKCPRPCSTRHLEVSRTREDDAALHDVVGDEGVQRTRGGRLEDDAVARRRRQAALRKGVRLVAPPEGVSTIQQRWCWTACNWRARHVGLRGPRLEAAARRAKSRADPLGARRAKRKRCRRVGNAANAALLTAAPNRNHRVRDRA